MLRANEDLKEKTQTNKTSNLPKAQENASDQVPISFSFDCDWLRGWRDIFRAITERSDNSWLLCYSTATLSKEQGKKSKVNSDFSKAVIEESNKRLPIWSITVLSLRQSLHLVW